MTRLDVPSVCSCISRPEPKRRRSCVEDGLVITVEVELARDENLSLAMLQGVGTSAVGLYQPPVFGRWLPLYTLMAQYSGINAVLDSSQKSNEKQKSSMTSNRRDALASSLQ